MNDPNKQKKSSLLIVDDEPRNIQLLGNLLNEHNYDVEFATGGEEALSWTASSQFDLILLDIMMPGMNGYDVCEKLKASPETKEIPVIFLTAKSDTEDIVKGFELGGVDYICKPFNTTELLRRIATHLEIFKSRRTLVKQNEIMNELLHVLSHDLTNSIGSITSFGELIKEDPGHMEEYVSYILCCAKNAMEVVNLSRTLLTAEEKPIPLTSLNLKKVIDQSVQIVREKLEAKSIHLEIEVPEEISVIAEEISLKNSVITNIMTNAIKFSQRESTITIEAKKKAQDHIEVKISDSGMGISQRMIANLFDLSKATNRDGTEGEKGTGFGMPIMKKFMEKYGGDVSIKSKSIEEHPKDHGTEVYLQFKC